MSSDVRWATGSATGTNCSSVHRCSDSSSPPRPSVDAFSGIDLLAVKPMHLRIMSRKVGDRRRGREGAARRAGADAGLETGMQAPNPSTTLLLLVR